jgi:hypothetical protein
MDDLVIVVEYPIVPPSHQPSVQQKSVHQQEEKKEVDHQQQYVRVVAPAYPIYASEQAVRYSPPSQQKVDQQQYVVNAPVVARPVSVNEKAVSHVPPSQHQDDQQYIYKPLVTRPINASSEQKVVSFSPTSPQPSVQQRSEQQEVDHQQQYTRVPAPAPPTNVSGNAVRYSPPNQRRVDQQKHDNAPVVARPVDVGEEKVVQDVPPGQQKVDQQHQSSGSEHPVEIPKPAKSGKKMDQVKLAHIEHFNNEESVKFSFCKRRPDGYYRHPNDCARILQCFGKDLFEYPKCEHGLAFNERKQACDYHFNVEGCAKQTGGTPRVKSAAKPIAPTHANRRRVCQGGYVHGEHVADPRDCSRFYRCVWGDLVPMSCGDGTVFNPKLSVCDYPAQVPNASCQMKGIVPSV